MADFEIKVYNTPTSSDHLTKDLTSTGVYIGSYKGTVRGEISVDAPEITVEATLETGNYCEIIDFGRYYYIRDRKILRTGLTVLRLESDPLMSFAAGIRSLPILATRCEQAAVSEGDVGYNAHLPDGLQPILVNELVQCKEIYRFSWSENFILVTVG